MEPTIKIMKDTNNLNHNYILELFQFNEPHATC